MSETPGSQAHLRTYWLGYAVLLLSLLLTCLVFFGHRRYIESRDHARFSQQGHAAYEEVNSQLNLFIMMMKGLRSLYAAHASVTPADLTRYFQVLKMEDLPREKGLVGVGVIYPVKQNERQAHLAMMQKHRPSYRLNSTNSTSTMFPLVYLERLGMGAVTASLGLDLGQNQVRREAMERCLEENQPVVTARTQLIYSDLTNASPGFVIYVPFYKRLEKNAERPEIAGFIFTSFDADKLWRSLLGSQYRSVDIEIYDGDQLTAENLLFDRDEVHHDDLAVVPRFKEKITAELFGRRWTFLFYSRPEELTFFEHRLPILLFGLGIAGSFLLFGFVCVQSNHRITAERLSRNLRDSEASVRRANEELARKIIEVERSSQRLRESETLYFSLVHTLPQRVFRKDLEGRFTFANAAFCAAFRIQAAELPGKTDFDFFPASLAKKYREDDLRLVTSRQTLSTIESFQPSPGENRFLHVVKTPLLDRDGNVSGIQGVLWDITDNKLAEAKLAAEKERLAVTLRSIGDAVVATDIEGRILLMNPVAEEMVEKTQAQVAGAPIGTIFALSDPQTRNKCNADFFLLLEGKPSDSLKPTFFVAPSGKELLLAKRAAPIKDGQGLTTGAVFVFRDVTQERKIEEELLRASKLESIGLLAGGIAHDFNNVLTGIVGNLSLLRETPDLPAEVAERMGLLERTAYKARLLTMQLLTFAKGGSPIKQTASVAEMVRESVEFALRGSNIRAQFEFEEKLSAVEMDTGQISQVIQNLVINGKQAMPKGGIIHVAACNCPVDGAMNIPLPPGKFVRISLRDTGCGIAVENLGKIFDPYFTTKPAGTGLGLATAYSIMKRHDGLVTVESEVGKGSTFHLFLPASQVQPAPAVPEKSGKVNGTGRILIMDDEPAIRTLLTAILKHFGYVGVAVENGEEAISTYQKARVDGEPFAAVIMDLTIPGGMGGKDAVAELLRLDPKVRAIVSSGYSNDPVLAEYAKYGFVARVEKPYRMPELAAVLHEVLQDGHAAR